MKKSMPYQKSYNISTVWNVLSQPKSQPSPRDEYLNECLNTTNHTLLV